MSKGSVVVIDNGAGLCKAGFGGDRDPVAIVPNCVGKSPASKKWLVADELRAADTDVTSVSLRRPFDRGYLVNPELQREVWDRVIRTLLRVDPNHSSLLLVEPLFNPPSVQRVTDEIVFEDFGFRSLCVADSPSLVHLFEASRGHSHCHQTQCSLVVDCGFSFTHAAPVLQNFTLNYAVKRLDLGGKVLTNYLKELVSYRSVNVMDETLIIDHAKEKLCFVSLDVSRDLRLARNTRLTKATLNKMGEDLLQERQLEQISTSIGQLPPAAPTPQSPSDSSELDNPFIVKRKKPWTEASGPNLLVLPIVEQVPLALAEISFDRVICPPKTTSTPSSTQPIPLPTLSATSIIPRSKYSSNKKSMSHVYEELVPTQGPESTAPTSAFLLSQPAPVPSQLPEITLALSSGPTFPINSPCLFKQSIGLPSQQGIDATPPPPYGILKLKGSLAELWAQSLKQVQGTPIPKCADKHNQNVIVLYASGLHLSQLVVDLERANKVLKDRVEELQATLTAPDNENILLQRKIGEQTELIFGMEKTLQDCQRLLKSQSTDK